MVDQLSPLPSPSTVREPVRGAYPHHETEFTDFLVAVWNTRRFVLLGLAVIATAMLGTMAVKSLLALQQERYEKTITLVFEGEEGLHYPNGTPFAVEDIIAPPVLDRLYGKHELEQADIPRAALFNGIGAELHKPGFNRTLQVYRQALQTQDLSSEEIQQAYRQFKSELDRQSDTLVRLSLAVEEGFPDAVAKEVLRDLPRVWSKYMVENQGVANLDVSLATQASVGSQLLDPDIGYVVLDELLRSKLEIIRENIAKLRKFENIGGIEDPETGMTLTDLEFALDELERYRINPLLYLLHGSGLSRRPEMTTAYVEQRIRELERQRVLLQHKVNIADEALRRYSRNGTLGREDLEAAGQPGSGGVSGANAIPHLGGDFLDRLLELGNSASDQEFRQQVLQQRVEFANEAATVGSQIQKLEQILRRIERGNSGAAISFLSEQSQTRLDEIARSMTTYMGATLRIYRIASKRNLSSDSVLYRDVTAARKLPPDIDWWRMTMTSATAMVLGLFVLVPAGLLWNRLRELHQR